MTNFTDFGLDAALLKALATEGYTVPTPIQIQAIPSVMAGRDLLGIAQTGTGKTAAFALPILHRLAADRRPAPRKGCRVLVLAPTRELASQIGESFKTYGRHLGFTVAVIFGGVAHRPQTQALMRGIDILVATPGRLLDHMGERNAVLSGTEIFVLDEADQMLDLGFVVPIRRIVKTFSQRRQNLFFSATMPTEIGKLASELLIDPVRVAAAPVATTVERVTQSVIHVEQNRKVSVLAELFADPAVARALVFTRTKRGADKVAKRLEMMGVGVAAIHGNKSQRQREIALADFKASRIRALVATDIAARGIDIDQVTHVVNFELPNVPESYVHRIGRTARAGAEGIAISLCDGEEREYLRDIERLTRQKIHAIDRRNDSKLEADAPKARTGSGPQRGRPESTGGYRAERRSDRGNGRDFRDERRPSQAHHGRAHQDDSRRPDRAPDRFPERSGEHRGGSVAHPHGRPAHAAGEQRRTESGGHRHPRPEPVRYGDHRPASERPAQERRPAPAGTGAPRQAAKPGHRGGNGGAHGGDAHRGPHPSQDQSRGGQRRQGDGGRARVAGKDQRRGGDTAGR